MERMQLHKWAGSLLIGVSIFATSAAEAADVFRVAYAGSMGVVMDRFIGPAFAKANDVEYQGIGQGAYGLARQLEGRLLQADVFVAITPGPIEGGNSPFVIATHVLVNARAWVIGIACGQALRRELPGFFSQRGGFFPLTQSLCNVGEHIEDSDHELWLLKFTR